MTATEHPLPDRDRDLVQVLLDEHVRASGALTVVDERTWAIRGEIAVDGEVILAEFDNLPEAQVALERLTGAERGRS